MTYPERDPEWDAMLNEAGVYVTIHRKHSKGSKRICKISDLDHLSLPRRAALEKVHDECCRAIQKALDEKKRMCLSDEVDVILDTIATVSDDEKREEENSLFLITSKDW